MRALRVALGALAGLACAGVARADAPAPLKVTFAVIVGVNRSVDEDAAPLKYADDDAARYHDLFRLLGARTFVLSRLDANTQRLHPRSAAEAQEPRRATFDRAMAQLEVELDQAAARGAEAAVYWVYAGHGNVKNGQGYITLEDSRITGAELAQHVRRLRATRVHVIVDACASYFLAQSRGPGGERRALEDLRPRALTEDGRVGLLLSTSSARESHEWDAFQSGVFSHEVRSGLYGAADTDGSGEVSYREIAAFVARANAAVPNERYRPDVYARPPRGTEALLDIRAGMRRRVVIDGSRAGHYFVEDGRGVRVADVHNRPGQALSLLRPESESALYLRAADGEQEFALDPAPDVLALAALSPSEPRTRARGAAHESFSKLFSLPFARADVDGYSGLVPPVDPPPATEPASAPRGGQARRTVGYAALGLGVAGLAFGSFLSIAANVASSENDPAESQKDALARNHRIAWLSTGAAISFGVGGALTAAGLVLALWPDSPSRRAAPAPQAVFAPAAPSKAAVSLVPAGLGVVLRGSF